MCRELKFRPIKIEDFSFFQLMWQEEKVVRYTNIKVPLSDELAKERMTLFLKLQEDMENTTLFTILYNDEPCGMVGCLPIDETKTVYGLFYQLGSRFWGKKIATQSAKWMLDYMVKHRQDIHLVADVVEANVASKRILENLGFVMTHKEKGAFTYLGKSLDVLYYNWQA